MLNLGVTGISKNAGAEYEAYLSPIQGKGRYLPYHTFMRTVPPNLDKVLAWSLVKAVRVPQLQDMIKLGDPPVMCKFFLTPTIQRAISSTDRHTTKASLELLATKLGEKSRLEYLLSDLIEDEAISSSQLEGAATTTKVAKNLLKTKRKPRSIDEKMILGNFKMTNFVRDNKDRELSVDLIKELHNIGVEGIADDQYAPGVFRNNDDVCVVDGEGDIVHQPPSAVGLTERIEAIVSWANESHEDNKQDYIHPLLKAITLHFAIGYEHPFLDGNGRVARALFYWYLFKTDFLVFRFISISHLLKSKAIGYGKSYLYTETDEMDLTYFLEFQCTQIIQAIGEFNDVHRKIHDEQMKFDTWLYDVGLYQKLNGNQRLVFNVAKNGAVLDFTAENVGRNLKVSNNTARSILNGLVTLGLFKKTKFGRQWVYTIIGSDEIIKNWES
ncbi:Fic family protein [Porticoccaceae bacterium]|nr:Fic family protein [Porticoccaceae bacterium]